MTCFPVGKRLTTFCASLALLHPLLSLTHWIFRSLMLPYKSSSHSAKCVRCAPLKGKRLTTFCASLCSYKMCSLCTAPLRGPPIGGQDCDGASYRCSAPYTLLPLRGISPQGETRDMERKTGRHILHVPFRCVPLWWLAPPPFPLCRGHYKAPLCCERLMKGMLHGVLFCPLNRGKSGEAG